MDSRPSRARVRARTWGWPRHAEKCGVAMAGTAELCGWYRYVAINGKTLSTKRASELNAQHFYFRAY